MGTRPTGVYLILSSMIIRHFY